MAWHTLGNLSAAELHPNHVTFSIKLESVLILGAFELKSPIIPVRLVLAVLLMVSSILS